MKIRPVISIFGATDLGCVRTNNEDNFRFGELGTDLFATVADGCGGEAAGEVASALAVQTFQNELSEKHNTDRDIAFVMRDAVIAANKRIITQAEQNVDQKGMGTTFSGLLFRGKEIMIVHVGDSRIYRKRDGELCQMSEDHTWVHEAVKMGKLTPEEAENHPRSSMLLRALGMPNMPPPDLDFLDARTGDTFLICSDGLSNMIRFDEIADALDKVPEPAVNGMIALARERGAPDNITAVVARIDDFSEGKN